MSCAHLLCCVTGSTLSPIILQLRFAKSGSSPAMYPNSVVHTGVKSLGCENRMAQPSPIHSWKLILPCEVSAVKLGASSLIRNMRCLLNCALWRRATFDTRSHVPSREQCIQPAFPFDLFTNHTLLLPPAQNWGSSLLTNAASEQRLSLHPESRFGPKKEILP